MVVESELRAGAHTAATGDTWCRDRACPLPRGSTMLQRRASAPAVGSCNQIPVAAATVGGPWCSERSQAMLEPAAMVATTSSYRRWRRRDPVLQPDRFLLEPPDEKAATTVD